MSKSSFELEQIACTLGWANTPPLDVLVKDINAHKANEARLFEENGRLRAALRATYRACKLVEALAAASFDDGEATLDPKALEQLKKAIALADKSGADLT